MAESFFERVHKQDTHTPDVLSCLANLSNDEVFTPPELVNKVLDMLPQELFKDPNTKFLDPATKTGVFLREIAKRLLIGLEPIYPDLQERIDHIFHEQLYGIAITELTSLLARRSLYCSKYPNGKYSICHFDNAEGNISFKKIPHIWKDRKCIFCGASQEMWNRDDSLETHAYGFIHCSEEHNKELFERLKSMKFDVIIGNPPYQLNDGMGGGGSSASPLYHFFIQQAKKLNPRYITMIVPSRWFSGGKGLDEFREEMLSDTHIKNLIDYPVASECFPGVGIKGGVCYFLWDRQYRGDCTVKTVQGNNVSELKRPLLEKNCDIFIRYNESIKILKKVQKFNEPSFESLVSSRKPFGLASDFRAFDAHKSKDTVKIYANKTVAYVGRKQVPLHSEWIDSYKIFISFAYGAGEDFPHQILNKPIFGGPNTCCTETYLLIGPFKNEKITKNVLSYIKTKFFRFMVLMIKNTQNATRRVYNLVPIQDFSEPWTDAKLYKKYGLTKEEINFIESMIKPMEDK